MAPDEQSIARRLSASRAATELVGETQPSRRMKSVTIAVDIAHWLPIRCDRKSHDVAHHGTERVAFGKPERKPKREPVRFAFDLAQREPFGVS